DSWRVCALRFWRGAAVARSLASGRRVCRRGRYGAQPFRGTHRRRCVAAGAFHRHKARMIDLLIGAFALVLVLILLHGFARADPRVLVKGVRYLGAGALVLAAAFFLVRGIVPAAVLLGS